MIGRPAPAEAAQYYFAYIDKATGDDPVSNLEQQLEQASVFLSRIAEDKSLHRYAPDKWSIREVLSHINDAERVFAQRALWFARGFDSPLPSFDQNVAVSSAHADTVSWAAHVEEFRHIRLSTISLFKNLPEDAWMKPE